MIDKAKIEESVRLLLEGIGEDPARGGLIDTPRRVADMYAEIILSEPEDLSSIVAPIGSDTHQEMVLVRDIRFYSLCEHHLVPFFGAAHVAYIPSKNGSIAGISRSSGWCGRRPELQLQERLTSTIADTMVESLHPLESWCSSRLSTCAYHAGGSRPRVAGGHLCSAVYSTPARLPGPRVLALIEAPKS